MLQTLREALAIVEALPEDRACRRCDHFLEASAHCRRWNAPVPPEVVPQGCEGWEEGVPF